MSDFEDLEGPRSNKRTVHVVENSNKRVVALTSRVEARNLKKKRDFRTSNSVEVEDGEAHIGDRIWFVFNFSGEIKAAYHDEDTARRQADDRDNIAGTDIRRWDITTEKLYGKEKLEERRERGFI